MDADLFSMDEMIKVNHLQPVTNPILLEKDNVPTIDGLLSYDIFGRSIDDRKDTWAYMELNGHFLNALVYKKWKRLDRKIEECVAGTTMFIVKNGKLERTDDDDPKGWTGLEELYKHYKEIKFVKGQSYQQNENVDFMNSLDIDEVFMSKLIIMPAYYRDLQAKGNGIVTVHEITDYYNKILRLTRALKDNVTGIDSINNVTRAKIQNLIVFMYTELFIKNIKGKNGYFRNKVLGKSVINGVRLVSTAPVIKTKLSEMITSFEYMGLPLSATITCFKPFIVKWLRDYFYNNIQNVKDKFPVKRDGNIEYVRLLNTDKFNDEFFEKKLNSYIHSYEDRHEIIKLENDKGYDISLRIIGNMVSVDNPDKIDSTLNRPCTWTDLFYMAAHDTTRDKHILVTRYPIEDWFGICAAKFNVVTTIKTKPMMIGGKFYKFYPDLDLDMKKSDIPATFCESLTFSNSYCSGYGGDYDGDQYSIRGVRSIQANQEAEKMMYSPTNFMGISGNISRTIEKEAIQCMYQLTCRPDEIIPAKPRTA